MGCGEWTYYEPGSEPDKCGVTVVTGGEVFECNVCQIARLRAEIERLTAENKSLRITASANLNSFHVWRIAAMDRDATISEQAAETVRLKAANEALLAEMGEK